MTEHRIESDSMGEVQVPKDALYGAQTQRAVNNFPISGRTMPPAFIRALAMLKAACAEANGELGELETPVAEAISNSAQAIVDGRYLDQFPVDVFQTGSGTSSNMNMNEVLATLASKALGSDVHPNDHINRGQSSNDVIPSALQVAVALEVRNTLLPALVHLSNTIETKAQDVEGIVKTGRTHLMDAMPITLSDELRNWQRQLDDNQERLVGALPRLLEIPLGGTAVGTGINAHKEMAPRAARQLFRIAGMEFIACSDPGSRMAAQDVSVEMSGHLRTLAVSLMKIANDLRWMNSGPLAGLAEIELQALQPGSSIMPGKVNPVIPEAVAMVCAEVMGRDVTAGIAGQSGNFQLNVMLPLLADSILTSVELLAHAMRSLADSAIESFNVNEERLAEALGRNPILVTALNATIGYDKAAAIAKQAYKEGRHIADVVREQTDLSESDIADLLDPTKLARPQD